MRKKEAIMYLPKNGKEYWTAIMEGAIEINPDIETNQPIVMSTAVFADGISVSGGVYKSEEPEAYNIKFFYVLDPNGNIIPYLIDPSDNEDFRETSRQFYLNEYEAGDLYILHLEEREEILELDFPTKEDVSEEE